ncbi:MULTISPECIES: adenylate/guanylate cyclase domain-containing protein [unclassified Leptolyngbya]|uniref:adenylate/guanylate cyclase domain-containing protein n=1 Tax=unclassified Leptolyngbya TaxID=2650499 RepID=UPI0016832C7F|nr:MULTISPECIES: adenylate/guanylate cyclase domain-containing protein [unclassified Leptolyngbya]MBD1912354.1 GAF domain-containing protein [Leptolyngbya sp. FACHB-8]MBD2158010.1 GAF domain-containing protein [Leptolyngbya sp. FACHB-16]
MADSNGNMLAIFSQGDRQSALIPLVKDLPAPQFVKLLDQITQEFDQCRRAIDLINNDGLETALEQILEAFTLKIGQILKADRTTIFLVDEEKEQLWSKVASGENGQIKELRIPLSVGIAGHVASTGSPLNIPDAYSHPMFNPEVDINTGYRTSNILCMPIFDGQHRVVAVAQLLNKQGDRPFDVTDEIQFEEFAAAMGVILESCTAFYMASRNQRGATALLNATTFLAQSLDLERTLQAVMNEARKLMQADRSTLFLLDRERGELWSKIATADGKELLEIRIPANRGIAGFVASTGQTLNIPNAYEDPRFDPSTDQRTRYLTRNILCMPVYNSEGKLIGVTQLINKYQGTFNRSDEEFMRAFNIQAGIALENAQLFERVLLEKQYQKDILQSLSDAVISTDLEGRIVTINDAALALLGCPLQRDGGRQQQTWIRKLTGRWVWDVVPVDNLRMRLEDSLKHGARHYVPEQTLTVGSYLLGQEKSQQSHALSDKATTLDVKPAEDAPIVRLEDTDGLTHVLAVRSPTHPNHYLPWNQETSDASPIPAEHVQEIERSINLTVNPLTNPEGRVRGGLVVLEDISQEKRMKATMYRYMTPGVAERVMALGEDALMVGERKDVTILFSDIRGYTNLTEHMEAADVVTLLNNYFETMVEAVFNFEGTLDKFIGDALMAVFGAPLPLQNHAVMAVRSALDMRRRLAEFNAERQLINQPMIRIGIGISSGEVVSGNIGSQKRMDYTVIGNGVDISSRLEGVTKEYGCDIILSEFTYQLCKDEVWVRELDRIRVKGKTQPIAIYELIGDRQSPPDDETQEFLDLYYKARIAYTHMDFKTAIQRFEQAQQLRPTDRAIAVHLERAHTYLLTPPSAHWDGVHTMTTK